MGVVWVLMATQPSQGGMARGDVMRRGGDISLAVACGLAATGVVVGHVHMRTNETRNAIVHFVGLSDSWISTDGAYLYQVSGNASKLVSYAVQPHASVDEITSVPIPCNSPQGSSGILIPLNRLEQS